MAKQIACLCVVLLLLVTPRKPPWECLAEPLHDLIVSVPPDGLLCGDEEWQEPLEGNVRLEIRFVSVPYSMGRAEVVPRRGYVSSVYGFMDGVQGDVRCSTLALPPMTVSDVGMATHVIGPLTLRVTRRDREFRLEYTAKSGATYVQEVALPDGAWFATNMGEHYVATYRKGFGLPEPFSIADRFLSWDETIQMECFWLVRLSGVEE